MKKTFSSLIFALVWSGQGLAKPSFEGPPLVKGASDTCLFSVYDLVGRYLELFDFGAQIVTVRFNSFELTTNGSYNQKYAANVSLASARTEISSFDMSFSSAFACEDLRILEVRERPIDTSNPLYACLNDEPTFGPLRAAQAQAFADLGAYHKTCQLEVPGDERITCMKNLNQTSQGKKLFGAIRRAAQAIKAAENACQSKYKNQL